jgi:hypothetical protein
MRSRRFAPLAVFCGTVALAGLVPTGSLDSGLPRAEIAAAPVESSPAPSPAVAVAPVEITKTEDVEITKGEDAAAPAPIVEASLPVPVPPAEPAVPAVVADLPPSAPEAASPLATADECLTAQTCIDRYLWSIYQRTPKQDCIKVSERVKVTVTKKGKTQTVTKTVTKLVDEDFAWKDPKAADKAGMPLDEYVIGGMDRSFKLKLYRALRAMDEAGLEPGITSAFRDDYRQAIASGKKAASDSSYHGGSRRGGYGHGLAADLVSVKGDTRAQRWITSEILWKWVDAHGPEYGIARPYLDRDPPHVGPIDGKEYADKRGARTKPKVARADTNKRHAPAASKDRAKTTSARTATPKARNI